MSTELTYPGLRCILEYLEPNKRLHIASRSPALRHIDKSIPIHIDKLQFENEVFSINEISYSLRAKSEILKSNDTRYKRPREEEEKEEDNKEEDEEDLLSGDINVGSSDVYRVHEYIAIRFKREESWDRNRLVFENHAPDGVGMKQASKQMGDSLLGHKTIYVENLHSELYVVHRLPKGLKLHTRVFDVKDYDFRYLLNIIDPSCAPLRKLGLDASKTTNFQHPLVKTAGTLLIHNPYDPFFAENFKGVSNKHVEFDIALRNEQIFEIVEIWKNDNRAIGAMVTFVKPLGYNNHNLLRRVPKEMNGRLKKLDVLVDGPQEACSCVSIPMNSTSEINIYEPTDNEVRMEVMPIGTACSTGPDIIKKSNAKRPRKCIPI